MKKSILFIIITGLILFFAGTVNAENISGTSARFARIQKNRADADVMKTLKIKLAIKTVLDRYHSPMAGEVDNFYNACVKYNLDCYLLPSIAGLESYFGQFIYSGSNNPFGWGRGLIMFDSWGASIDTVASGLRHNYIDKGAETVEQIGAIYCEGNTWASKVNFFMKQFREEEGKISLFSGNFPVEL